MSCSNSPIGTIISEGHSVVQVTVPQEAIPFTKSLNTDDMDVNTASSTINTGCIVATPDVQAASDKARVSGSASPPTDAGSSVSPQVEQSEAIVTKPQSRSTTISRAFPPIPSHLASRPTNNDANAWGNLSYSDLITLAILYSPRKSLTLNEIYEWITANVPYFNGLDHKSPQYSNFKNSILRTLSHNEQFKNITWIDPAGAIRKAVYWTVDTSSLTDVPSGHILPVVIGGKMMWATLQLQASSNDRRQVERPPFAATICRKRTAEAAQISAMPPEALPGVGQQQTARSVVNPVTCAVQQVTSPLLAKQQSPSNQTQSSAQLFPKDNTIDQCPFVEKSQEDHQPGILNESLLQETDTSVNDTPHMTKVLRLLEEIQAAYYTGGFKQEPRSPRSAAVSTSTQNEMNVSHCAKNVRISSFVNDVGANITTVDCDDDVVCLGALDRALSKRRRATPQAVIPVSGKECTLTYDERVGHLSPQIVAQETVSPCPLLSTPYSPNAVSPEQQQQQQQVQLVPVSSTVLLLVPKEEIEPLPVTSTMDTQALARCTCEFTRVSRVSTTANAMENGDQIVNSVVMSPPQLTALHSLINENGCEVLPSASAPQIQDVRSISEEAILSNRPANLCPVSNKCLLSDDHYWDVIPLSDLITQAILSSPEKRLRTEAIHDWLCKHVPYFRNIAVSSDTVRQRKMKNSVHMALNQSFVPLYIDQHKSWGIQDGFQVASIPPMSPTVALANTSADPDPDYLMDVTLESSNCKTELPISLASSAISPPTSVDSPSSSDQLPRTENLTSVEPPSQNPNLRWMVSRTSVTRQAWGKCTVADLVANAILSSPEKRLTCDGIRNWLCRNVPHFYQLSRASKPDWMDCVRKALRRPGYFESSYPQPGGLPHWSIHPKTVIRPANQITEAVAFTRKKLPRVEKLKPNIVTPSTSSDADSDELSVFNDE